MTAAVPEAPPPAASAPAPAPAPNQSLGVYGVQRRTADRDGLVFMGGVAFSADSSWWRVDALMPLHVQQAPQLRAGVQLVYDHESAAIPELAIEAYLFGIYPTATYDWRLPITSSAGDFVVTAEGGLGLSIARIKIDQPFMPGNFETVQLVSLRVATAFQFRARAGYVISVQPLGVEVPLGDDAPPQYNLTTDTIYELAVMAGYQLR